jgi:hypothetical protein
VRVGTTNTYRYTLTTPLTPGTYTVEYVAGTFRDVDGNLNLAETETFFVADATAAVVDPTPLGRIDRELLNNDRSYIDVSFTPVSGNWNKVVDANNVDLRIAAIASIVDDAAEFSISGADAQNAGFSGLPDAVIIPKNGSPIVLSRNTGTGETATQFAVRILAALDAAGVDATDVHRREATLDDVFLALTVDPSRKVPVA